MNSLISFIVRLTGGSSDRKHAVEIFTTNYDYLFEIGMEHHGVPYYDGFTGSYKPFFYPESLEEMGYLPRQTKLWKVHGSLGLKKTRKAAKSFAVHRTGTI